MKTKEIFSNTITRLEKVIGDLEGFIKICNYKPRNEDKSAKSLAIATGKDIQDLITEMKSGFVEQE